MVDKQIACICAICFLLVLSQVAQAQQIVQITSGWCSPNVANVVGDVVIKCIGIPPPVHKKLTEELARLKITHQLETQQLIEKANDWVNRYNTLNEYLQALTGSPEEINSIRKLIAEGQFETAAARLDTAIAGHDKHLETLAEYHYLRASVAALSFDMEKASYHIGQAYRYQPKNPTYLLAYSDFLIERGQLTTAKSLLRQTLPFLRELARTGSVKETANLINALDKLSVILIKSGSTEEVDSLSNEALSAALTFFKNGNDQQELKPEASEMLSKLVYTIGRNTFIAGRLDAAENILGTAFSWNLNLCSTIATRFCLTAANAASLNAQIDSSRGNYERATQRFQLALDTLKWYEGDTHPLPDRAAILFLSAEAYIQQKNFEEAEKTYRRILSTWQEGEYLARQHRYILAHAHNKIGEFTVMHHQQSEGEAAFRRALELTKDTPDPTIKVEWALASMNLGNLFASQKKGAQAVAYAAPAAQTLYAHWQKDKKQFATYYARSLFVLGYSQIVAGNKNEGCENLRHVTTVEPGGPWDQIIARDQVSCK